MRKKFISTLFPPLANVVAAVESGFCAVGESPWVGR